VTIDKLRREFDRKKRATEFVKNSPLDIADRIIAALEAELERQKQTTVWTFARAEKAEAERDQALFVADGWHRQFKRAAKARREEGVRAEKAEAETELLKEELCDTLSELDHLTSLWNGTHVDQHPSYAALQAAARKWEWVAEDLQMELLQAALEHDLTIPTLAARLARYEEDHGS
jgi:hypothetical protein